ncbi:MAG: hypothetical protein HYW62_01605 [Candidatus Levybacteria bacterium]|nr:hypothetical protein [Candidatus Levybacteria bacterium]
MGKNIGSALKNSKTLHHVKHSLVRLFKDTKKKNSIEKIGYVAGIITSGGPEYFKANRRRLADYVGKLRKIHNFPMFSAIDVFTSEVYERLEEWKLPFSEREVKARSFWRKILKSGHVTDIFMTPRFKKSKGASDEHKTAKEIGLTIHYMNEDKKTKNK